MKARRTLGLLIVCATTLGASDQGRRGQSMYNVTVHMNSSIEMPGTLFNDSQAEASMIFSMIRVRLTWKGPRSSVGVTCAADSGVRELDLQIDPHASVNASSEALAMSIPDAEAGAKTVVFFDRVNAVMQAHHVPETRFLGYVLAHEIAHVLQGVARHSPTGIMQAHWNEPDFKLMRAGLLAFSDEDVQLIRRNLAARQTQERCSGLRTPEPRLPRGASTFGPLQLFGRSFDFIIIPGAR